MTTYALRSTQRNMFAKRYTIVGYLKRTVFSKKSKMI